MGGAEAWSKTVSEKRGKEWEPASKGCGKGGLSSWKRTERRGRSRGWVRMEEQQALGTDKPVPGENTRREEGRGESVNR